MPTLLDDVRDTRGRRLRDLRISVIDSCNFRCGYCMPADHGPYPAMPSAARLTFDEIDTLVRAFCRVGVRKVRLTGGEPLLRRGLTGLIERLAAIDGVDDLAMTTNGSRLAPVAATLRSAGLDRITISLDAVEPTRFLAMTGGRGSLDVVLAGIDRALAAGFSRVKINCVVRAGWNDDQILPIVRRFRGTGAIVRFIEFMDVGMSNAWTPTEVLPSASVHRMIHAEFPLEPLPRTEAGEVAERYRFVDGTGEIGLVSAVSQPFCGECHRARVTVDGVLHTCLFSARGVPLRASIARGPAALESVLRSVWAGRSDRYSESRSEPPVRIATQTKRIEMYLIGG